MPGVKIKTKLLKPASWDQDKIAHKGLEKLK